MIFDEGNNDAMNPAAGEGEGDAAPAGDMPAEGSEEAKPEGEASAE